MGKRVGAEQVVVKADGSILWPKSWWRSPWLAGDAPTLLRADGRALWLSPCLPLGGVADRFDRAGDAELWLVDFPAWDFWHAARPADIAAWQEAGARVEGVHLREEGTFRRALLVTGRRGDRPEQDERRWPLMRVRDGLVERHFTEGGFETQGFFVPPYLPAETPQEPTSKQVRRAFGYGLNQVRFADACDGYIHQLYVEQGKEGFELTLRAIAEGMENRVSLSWRPEDGAPREWLLRTLATVPFLPGAGEYWG